LCFSVMISFVPVDAIQHPYMKSLFSRFLQKKPDGPSAQQMRLSLARFRHLLRLYGRLVSLCADAEDKQSGLYILDKAYILSVSDRAFGIAKGMVYDLSALTGQQYGGLYDLVEVFERKQSELFLQSGSALSTAGNEEEYEYRLLRETREIFCSGGNSAVSWSVKPAIPDLLGVAQSIQRDACHFFAGLVQAMSSANEHPNSTLPVRTSFVDLMIGLSGSSRLPLRADSNPTDSVPTGEFLKGFLAPAIWDHACPDSTDPQAPSLVTVELEESMLAIAFHRHGYDLFDVQLSCAPEANYFYCRFSRRPEPSLKEEILKRLGFFVRRGDDEITGWIDSQPLVEIAAKLKTVSKMSAVFLQPSSAGSEQPESGIDHFLRTYT
jgi:hypothetical protein